MTHLLADGRTSLGGYELLGELKSGGMGDVFLARRRAAGGFERLVALKTIRRAFAELREVRTMFLDEAAILARLGHPAIAQVYDFGEDGDTLYLAMEYVAGIRFSRLARLRPPPAIAARVLAEACRGLHAVHELADLDGRTLGVVHRDVSPENLMLTFEGRVKVLDFGIALVRGRQAPVTELGTIKGKPPYLSPEQLKNEPLDRRSDVFSAAVVLHELLTGEPLFTGDSVYAVARAIEHEPIVPPSARCGALPAGLDEAVLKGLARDPSSRWPTALAFAEELDDVAAAAGIESLESFARRELTDDREQHQLQLKRMLRPAEAEHPATARASGVMTAQGGDVSPSLPLSAQVPAAAGDSPHVREGEWEIRPLRGRALAAAAVAVMIAAVAVGVVLLRRAGTRPAGVAGVVGPIDAGIAPIAPVAIESDPAPAVARHVADAGTPELPQAAQPAPARGRRPRAAEPKSPPGNLGVEPEPSPPAKAVAKEPGFITVAAEPFALVRIDGVDVGTTPVLRRSLPAGDHEIVLSSPDTGVVLLRRTVTILPGKLERIIIR